MGKRLSSKTRTVKPLSSLKLFTFILSGSGSPDDAVLEPLEQEKRDSKKRLHKILMKTLMIIG